MVLIEIWVDFRLFSSQIGVVRNVTVECNLCLDGCFTFILVINKIFFLFCMNIYIYFSQDDLRTFWYVREYRAIFVVLVDNCAIIVFSFKIVLFWSDFYTNIWQVFEVIDFSMFQSYCCWLLFRMIMRLWNDYEVAI